MWIDTHCHLDAPEFSRDLPAVREQARHAGVRHCILPAVTPAHFETVVTLAHAHRDSYALGIHPLWIETAPTNALEELERQLRLRIDDPRLVAVGEIGLDYFVPALKTEAMRPSVCPCCCTCGPAWITFSRAWLKCV
jgi:TatD DNase family protein